MDEIQGGVGPFRGTVRGPLSILVIVLVAGFYLVAWQIDKGNQALAAGRALSRGEHDAIMLGQQAIVRAQEDNTCMLALPSDTRAAAVAWTRTNNNERYRSVCEYVVTVYLAKRSP